MDNLRVLTDLNENIQKSSKGEGFENDKFSSKVQSIERLAREIFE